MKFKYIEETDSFYVIFSNKTSVETEEIAEGINVDYDDRGNLIGIEIFSAKSKIDMNDLQFDSLPFSNINFINKPAISLESI